MTVLIVQFIALAGVIVFAGSFLAKYADAIGEITGMGRSLAGLVLLAAATSLPELAIDISAALIPNPDLAAGDLFGSSLFNLLILAVLDLLYVSRGRMLSREAAAHSISAVTSILLTGIALLGMLVDTPFEVFGLLGPGTAALTLAYVLCLRLVYFDQQFVAKQMEANAGPEGRVSATHISRMHAFTGYGVCTLVILIAAPFLAHTADALAAASGLGGSFVGTTFVALTTSLPEVVTTWSAVRMGAFDMAVGNIFGSNAFNMAILPIVDIFYDGPLLAHVAPVHAVTAAAVMIITAVATIGILYRAERRYWFLEADASLVILLVIGALVLVYRMGG